MNAAYLFPGQGAQYVGMGKELNDHFPAANLVFNQAAEFLGHQYIDVIFEGPEDKLRQTQFTQTSLFIMSMAAAAILREAGWQPTVAAGHSLGEYSALCVAGAFDLETGLTLVKARGEAIQQASEHVPGAMAALVGLDREKVQALCAEASSNGVCEAVNFNCPGQIVIAGAKTAVDTAIVLAQQAGALKAIPLNVSGPFHSSLMKPAAEKMADVLAKATIQDATIPVYMNCDATSTQKADDIREKLVRQIDHAVLWEDTIKNILSSSVPDTFVEVGAGRVLSGLLRRIDRKLKAVNIEDKKSAEALLEKVG